MHYENMKKSTEKKKRREKMTKRKKWGMAMEMSEELNDWITERSRTSRTELAELDPRETN